MAQRAIPTTVTASFWLWIASVVVSVIAAIIAISSGQYTAADVNGDAAVARAVAPIATLVGIALGAALRLIFAIFMYRGRNWARIVLLIVAVITAFAGVTAVLSGSVLEVFAVLVTIVAAVLMYVPSSNPYFRRS